MNKAEDTYNKGTTYEGFPYVTVFHKQVQDELDRRSQVDFRKTDTLIPWIRVTSGLKNITPGKSDSDFRVLSPLATYAGRPHTKFNFKDLYPTNFGKDKDGNDKENAFKPLPGIESMTTSYKSTWGGIRTAEFKWKVFTLAQFEELAPYFLTPGIGILVEWGNDSSITEYSLDLNNDDELNKISGENFYKSYQYFKDRSFKQNCRYDAMTGIIQNFEYSLNEEGGFDCVTHIVSSGALMYSLDTRYQFTNKDATENNDKNESIRKIRDYVLGPELEKDIKSWNNSNSKRNDVQVYVDKNKQNKNSYFVTWGFIEDFIVTRNINIKITEGESDQSLEDLFKLRSIGDDDKSILISNHQYLRSTNLSVCILPQTESGDTINGLTFYPEDGLKTSGKVRNIFVNLDIVKESFRKTELLRDALLNILNEINYSCLNYWDFSLKIRETNGTMSVVDSRYVDKSMGEILKDSNNLKMYNFKVFGGNGILNALNFDTKMSEAMAMVAMYAHHRLPGDNNVVNRRNDVFAFLFGNINEEYTDEFIKHLRLKNPEPKSSEGLTNVSKETQNIRENSSNAGFSEKAKKFLPQLEWRKLKEVGESDSTSIDEEEAMRRLVNNLKTRNVNSSHAITPADFSLEMPGISGIRIGDLFSVDSIPEKFKKHSVFQVVAVDDSVDSMEWKTTIRGILRVIDPSILE